MRVAALAALAAVALMTGCTSVSYDPSTGAVSYITMGTSRALTYERTDSGVRFGYNSDPRDQALTDMSATLRSLVLRAPE